MQQHHQFIQRNSAVLWRELAGEAVLLDPTEGCSYNLNQVGTFVWKMLEGNVSIDQIVTALCEQYEVEPAYARIDAEQLLSDLRSHHLIVDVQTDPAS